MAADIFVVGGEKVLECVESMTHSGSYVEVDKDISLLPGFE